jgi:GNAT superfamily N-acetyltransferase
LVEHCTNGLSDALLARVEDASINASAPPQQLWMDGWLLRFNPGKAKRARCINALATCRRPLVEQLQQAHAAYAQAGLPLVVRITRFTQPPELDKLLAEQAFTVLDDTEVMVLPGLAPQWRDGAPNGAPPPPPLPVGLRFVQLGPQAYAETVGLLRGSPPEQRQAHAQRLQQSPVSYQGYAIQRTGSACSPVPGFENRATLDPANSSAEEGFTLACGQFAREADLVGLYDVFTHPSARNQGLAGTLCKHLLTLAALQGAKTAYLQVEAGNPARRIYSRLGFVSGYRYHYRQAPT